MERHTYKRSDTGYSWSTWVGFLVFVLILAGLFMFVGGDGNQQMTQDQSRIGQTDAPSTTAPAPSAPTTQQ